MTNVTETDWPGLECEMDMPHVHVVGHQDGRRNINIVAPFGQFTSASNGRRDVIEVSFHSGMHPSHDKVAH